MYQLKILKILCFHVFLVVQMKFLQLVFVPTSETSLKYSTDTAGLDLQLQYSESGMFRFKVGVTLF